MTLRPCTPRCGCRRSSVAAAACPRLNVAHDDGSRQNPMVQRGRLRDRSHGPRAPPHIAVVARPAPRRFADLVDRRALDSAYRYATLMLGDRGDAEDATHDAAVMAGGTSPTSAIRTGSTRGSGGSSSTPVAIASGPGDGRRSGRAPPAGGSRPDAASTPAGVRTCSRPHQAGT